MHFAYGYGTWQQVDVKGPRATPNNWWALFSNPDENEVRGQETDRGNCTKRNEHAWWIHSRLPRAVPEGHLA